MARVPPVAAAVLTLALSVAGPLMNVAALAAVVSCSPLMLMLPPAAERHVTGFDQVCAAVVSVPVWVVLPNT